MVSRQLYFLALLLFAQASIAEVTVTYIDCSPGGAHAVAMSEGNPLADEVLVGRYNWQDAYSEQIYHTACIDLETLASTEAVTYQVVPLTEARAEPGLAGGQLSPARAYLLEAFWGQFNPLATSNEAAIAFGLGVYEIVYDGDSMDFSGGYLSGDYDFEGGIFDGSDGDDSGIWAITKGWLQALDYYGASTALIAWAVEGGQDQILEDDQPTAARRSSWGELKSLY